jgi:hydroxypyruvate isomerase
MPRLSVCIEMVFRPLAFVERIEAVKGAGYSAFEFWSWQDKDMPAVQATKEKLGLDVAAFGVRAGHARRFEPPAVLGHGGSGGRVARRLDCPSLIVTTGNTLPDVPRAQQRDDLQRGLEGVAQAAARGGSPPSSSH